MQKNNLSEKQQEIVAFNDGALLVKAGAGSGKTRVLTARIKRLFNEKQRKILAITFTNKAAAEIAERLSDLLNIKAKLFIGTFHGFCQNVLENHGKNIGYLDVPHIFEDEADRLKLVEQAILQTPTYKNVYIEQETKKKLLSNALNFISEIKRRLITEDKLLEEQPDEDLVLLYREYQDILLSQNAIDFDDLTLLTYNLFTSNPKIASLYRRTYEYICIDEAQDLNYAQYQLLRSITGTEHKNVMMVGDPNQSIFAFAGSSSEYMNRMFIEDYSPKVIELKENYRSSKSVLLAAQKIIPDSSDLMNIVIPGIFEIQRLQDESTEADWIIEKINYLKELKTHSDIEGCIEFENMAVLARNKYVFNHLTVKLDEGNIPYYYKITPGTIKFESKLMVVFDLAFRVKINPLDTLHWYRLLDLYKNVNASSLNDLAQQLVDPAQKEILIIVNSLNTDGTNFRKQILDFSNKICETELIKDIDERAMVLNDIKELLEHWRQYSIKTEKESLQQFKNSMALGKTHPLYQPKGITLSTVHTMKGQEYDIVFLMGMDDETFPDYRAIRNGGADIIQEKNNAYVAFTRAKRFLYVTWPGRRLMPWGDSRSRQRSRFLSGF